jgi:hypothetical protein
LYHWVENRAVPADNNRAERELRPTVIARKVSFGSQSDAGAKTREVLMSVVHTLAKRVGDAVSNAITLRKLRCVRGAFQGVMDSSPYDALRRWFLAGL